MNSSIFKLSDVSVVILSEEDFYDDDVSIELLSIYKKHKTQKAVIDIGFLNILQSSDIKRMDKLSKLFMLNNVRTIFCGFDEKAVCTVVHFIDEFYFETATTVDRALDALNSGN